MDAWSARDAGRLTISDLEQLRYACQEHAVIFTHDDDFLVLANKLQGAQEHWGIIYGGWQKLSIGECIRRLLDYAVMLDGEDMRNQVEFL